MSREPDYELEHADGRRWSGWDLGDRVRLRIDLPDDDEPIEKERRASGGSGAEQLAQIVDELLEDGFTLAPPRPPVGWPATPTADLAAWIAAWERDAPGRDCVGALAALAEALAPEERARLVEAVGRLTPQLPGERPREERARERVRDAERALAEAYPRSAPLLLLAARDNRPHIPFGALLVLSNADRAQRSKSRYAFPEAGADAMIALLEAPGETTDRGVLGVAARLLVEVFERPVTEERERATFTTIRSLVPETKRAALLDALAAMDVEIAANIAETITVMGALADTFVQDHLRHPAFTHLACKALRARPTSSMVPELRELLPSLTGRLRVEALGALAACGDASPALDAFDSLEEPALQAALIGYIADHGGGRGWAKVRQVAKDRSAAREVLQEIVPLLGERNERKAQDRLIARLEAAPVKKVIPQEPD